MALTPRLDLRQSQTLVMTPQLQQAIKLLQMSNLEISAFVEQELERNPLLERTEGDGDSPVAGETEAPAERERVADGEALQPINGEIAEGLVPSNSIDTEYENLYPEDSSSDRAQDVMGDTGSYIGGSGGNSSFDSVDNTIEQTIAEGVTLQSHLLAQLPLEIADPAQRLIAAQLIGAIDETGYLTEPLEEFATRLGCAVNDVETVLARLQKFDPAGVFARSLSECLALQLREKNRLDPAMQALLDNLDLLARRDMPGLMRVCGVDAEDIADMAAEIRALDPKPGLAFESEVTQTLVPDVFVRPNTDGGWLVELNSETLPKVLVNARYHAKVAKGAKTKADKTYLSECLNSANWLVKSLDQRANTILKVASEIVRQQDGFFAHGVQHLRPLNLRTIAEAIDMHESTVSRVTSNKYIATARGIYEMKFFFSSAIASSDGGEAHSAEAVRSRIRDLIDAEKPDEILSDDRLVEILKGSGIDIARRTVAKYREGLKIPSSVQRRRLKTLSI